MAKCGSCIHKDACAAWIRHGELLYDDFEYSVEDCPYYGVRCKNCGWWHRFNSPIAKSGVCDKYAMTKSEDGYCDTPLLEERKYPWKN